MADADEFVEMGDFARDVRAGLAQAQKVIPARWLYDERGSEIFEAITDVADYYPTRTEVALLGDFVADAAAAVGPGRAIVEFGSGSSTKTPLLLRAAAPSAYVPVDISGAFLRASAAALAADFPGLAVHPVEADFTRRFALPALDAPWLGFFPGSTIGNLTPGAAVDVLRGWGGLLGAGSWLLIGFDLAKDKTVLEAAYDDSEGVTAAFNLNLLTRVNRELAGTLRLEDFCHRARWNAAASRIEMHLEAQYDTAFNAAGQHFSMKRGETIHTENSHKWTLEAVRLMARAAGWTPVTSQEDANNWFSLQLWRCDEAMLQP
jgi:dimethylhistidine N-methyltransferase